MVLVLRNEWFVHHSKNTKIQNSSYIITAFHCAIAWAVFFRAFYARTMIAHVYNKYHKPEVINVLVSYDLIFCDGLSHR